jgi:hypothetical protein
MTTRKVYEELASLIQAVDNCVKSNNIEWRDRHTERIEQIVKNHMPSGAGVDSGTTFDFDRSTSEKLVLQTGYHHMNENGMYNGWTGHMVTVRPSLASGFVLSISGRNRNDIKDYLGEMFDSALRDEVKK